MISQEKEEEYLKRISWRKSDMSEEGYLRRRTSAKDEMRRGSYENKEDIEEGPPPEGGESTEEGKKL